MVHARQKSPRMFLRAHDTGTYDFHGAILWLGDMNYEGEGILECKPRFLTRHQGIHNTPLAAARCDEVQMSQHARDCM